VSDHLTWQERMMVDPSLAEFVRAEIARAGVDVHALRAENEHLLASHRALSITVRELQAQRKGKP
jgi:hypothetical protein